MHHFFLKVKSRFNNIIDKNWIWAYALIVISFAIIINLALTYLPVPTAKNLHTSDWLVFWGSYLGSVLGCAVAIAALKQSQQSAARQHEEFQAQLEESRKQAQKQYEENEKNRRLSVQPLITMDISPFFPCKDGKMLPADFSEFKYYFYLQDAATPVFSPFTPENIERISVFLKDSADTRAYRITLSNIGLGPACCMDISAEIENSVLSTPPKYGFQSFGPSQSKSFLMILHQNLSFPLSCIFTITFSDIFEGNHQIIYHLKFDRHSFNFSPMTFFHTSIQGQDK